MNTRRSTTWITKVLPDGGPSFESINILKKIFQLLQLLLTQCFSKRNGQWLLKILFNTFCNDKKKWVKMEKYHKLRMTEKGYAFYNDQKVQEWENVFNNCNGKFVYSLIFQEKNSFFFFVDNKSKQILRMF